jgi:hypothetical protein
MSVGIDLWGAVYVIDFLIYIQLAYGEAIKVAEETR